MASLYSNENFSLPAVLELRRLGHDVFTIQETGRADQAMPDESVPAFAAEQQRVLITLNRRHFILLHNSGRPHTGILACTFDPDFVALVRRVHTALTQESDMRQKLVRVNRR